MGATHNLTITRGDSAAYVISARYADGTPRPFIDGDTVYFTVRKSTSTDKILIQRIITQFNDGSAQISIAPNDTRSLLYGEYVYDIQLNDANGNVATIINPSIYTVAGEVTWD